MWLARSMVKANLVAEMTHRFPARHGDFPEPLKISELGFPSTESLREWGKVLNRASWFNGWFTPSEFLACATFGRSPKSDKPNLIDLMFNTQTRPPELMSFTTSNSLKGDGLGEKTANLSKTKKKRKKTKTKKTKKPPKRKTGKKATGEALRSEEGSAKGDEK